MVSQTLLATAALAATASASKRGYAYNDGIDISGCGDNFITGRCEISWTYNWDSTTSSSSHYDEYVPMLWSSAYDHTRQWNDNANNWLNSGSSHLLGFNEPDRPDQAHMSVGDAVNAWRQYMAPFGNRAKLGAPAVSNGGYNWLKDFLNQCQGCKIDFVPVHWYNDHSQEYDFEDWVNSICSLAGGRKLWITEFKGWGSDKEQADFLSKALPFLDNNSCVERYAYFGINNGNRDMVQGNGPDLTNLGIWYSYNVPFDEYPSKRSIE